MVRVLVAEDEEPMRTSICDLIGADAGLELAGTAADVHTAIELARTTRPDVALLDVRIPGVDAPRMAREIRAVSPGTRVLALAVDGDRANLLDMLRAGAIGFLGRTETPAEIVDAIHRACRGQASLSAVSAFELALLADREARGRLDHRRAARRAVLTRLVASEEEERRRIARDIHDDSIQVMTAAGMRLQILRRSLDDADQLGSLDELEQAIGRAIGQLRRLLVELRPNAVDNHGLGEAIQMYLDDVAGESETVYELEDRLLEEPAEDTRIVLYRIAQELLTNVRRHAGAASATVTLGNPGDGYYIRVQDDGVGFAYDPSSPGTRGRLGLVMTRERAEFAGGWLRVESSEGRGTIVEVWIPRLDPGDGDGRPGGER
jgi:signal transduction histidine kinase